MPGKYLLGIHPIKNMKIEVIATTISGSISDWGKISRIVPLFRKHGWKDVSLHSVNSHSQARKLTHELAANGTRTIISAGGSGTFNSVLEGCIDSKVELENFTLGFLRKGSADLIGKSLGMPDEIEDAVKVFVDSLSLNRTVKCDVIQAKTGGSGNVPRHFVGYAGAEIFGMIPRISENRFTKYYKGFIGQVFGDLGPFFVSATLAVLEKICKQIAYSKTRWKVLVDGEEAFQDSCQVMIIVNGDLGPDLPFARSVPLGSGNFFLFIIKDMGLFKLPGQFKHAWDSSIMEQKNKWGFESYLVEKILKIEPDIKKSFPVNIDGSTMHCRNSAIFRIIDQINLISKN